MVIETENRFLIFRAPMIIAAILCLVVLPYGQAHAIPSLGIPKQSELEDKSWWEDWSADTNKNKIDDNLEWYIGEENLGSEDMVRVVVDYDHKPLLSDEGKLISNGGEIKYVSKYLDSIVVNVSVGELSRISSWKEVVMIEFAPDAQPTLGSALPSIGVPNVWQTLGYNGEGATVCIIDTGIDDEHAGLDDLDDDPETDDPKVIAFYDAQSHPNQDDGTYEPYDNHGHGTHCAGVATGTGAPGYNNIGVAPKAKLVGVKIGGGSIPYDAAVRGVEWAIANKDKFGIDILSNSWGLYIGGPANQNGESALSRLMDEAVDAGLVVFCAAGNTAVSLTVYSPADSEKAITVGSVNDDHILSVFSSQGPTADGRIKPDVCAVGEDVRAPNANTGTGYVSMSGTSMACPMAAGLAALMLDANPHLEPDNVKQIMHETSEHNTDARFPISPNNGYGWGVVEAYGAVKRSRDLTMTRIDAPPKVHEGDIIRFVVNTTYTRTMFTNRGIDGMRLLGEDDISFRVSIPATWTIPFNISVTSEGEMEYDAYFSVPRYESGMWILEAEFQYSEDVNEPTEATPKLGFQSMTPTVAFDTTYSLFFNYTLNEMNSTKFSRAIVVDNQDPPSVWIESPLNGEKVSGIVSVTGGAYDPDVFDEVERVEVRIETQDWVVANGTDSWQYQWDTTDFNNGWYNISVMAYDSEDNSSVFRISVLLDNFNFQPTATIVSITPNPANEGEEVSFSGYGTDSDGYIVRYEWKSNIQGYLNSSDTFSSSTLDVGVHDISFRVKDNDGVWSQKMYSNLRINQIPMAFIDSISPIPANEGDTITFAGHGNDDREIVAYNWRSSIEGFLSDLPSFSRILSFGVHEIYLRVQDDDAVWSQEVMQTVRVNRIPEAEIDSISPNPATEEDTVYFAGHGSDDGNIIAYEWRSNIDGVLNESASFSSIKLSLGEHVIMFRVLDNDYVWSDYVISHLKIKPVPNAYIDSISPNPANETESVMFQGHGEDVGKIINYSWRSSVDGPISNKNSFSANGLSPGIHTIFFSVENDNETWSDEVQEILRINGAPVAFIDSISPNPALVGQEVLFQGHGVDDKEVINYHWESSINGHMGSSSQFSTNQLSTGDHLILFKVQDSDYLWSQEVSIELVIHKKPSAYIDKITPNPANENELVTFSGHGYDDGYIIAWEWYSDIDGFLNATHSFSLATLSSGEHDISFRVMDDNGVWSDFTKLSLRINEIPSAFIDSISPNPAIQWQSITLTGHGMDDRNIAGYNWHSSIDGFLSTQSVFITNKLSNGNHIISFTVRDDDDVWSEEVTMNLRINQIPVAYIDSISPNRINEGESIVFKGHANDDGSIVTYNWTSSIDGLLSNKNNFTTSSLSIGNHIITLTVLDNENTWSYAVIRTVRVNQLPVAYIDLISPNPALTDENVRFSGHASDDGEVVEYYWRSNIDGFLSSSISFSWIGLSAGKHEISLRVKDDDDIWSHETYYMGLLVHQKPTAKIISVSPSSPKEDDEISFIGEGVDDGLITNYNWTSSIDGFLSDWNEFTTILSPGTHTISFNVKDDMGVWSKKALVTLYVNDLPKAIIDLISPNPSEEGELVSLSGHGEDFGAVVSYRWSSDLDGIIGTESSFTISSLSSGKHEISFKVKDNSGVWSSEAKSTLIVEKRTNIIPSIYLFSPTNYEVVSDSISVEVEAFDEDGRVVRIEARVDDNDWIKISDYTYGSYYIDTKDMAEGEHIVYVRAYDGEDYSNEEFVIIRVDHGEEETSFAKEERLFISLIIVVILTVCAIFIFLLILSRRRRRQYIRL